MAEKIRVQKILADAGVASRRKSEEIIAAGRVKVNGHTVKLGDSAGKKDIITVDGEKLITQQDIIYVALHKPRGFVSTMQDERGRKCVAALVKDIPERIYPVGRLDKDSEGLLFMTNDGDFANLIMHPKTHVAKTYRVTVRPGINEEQLNRISIGIVIDGKKTAPAKVKVLEEGDGRAVLEIILYEGRNREIRKMCEALSLEVARLKRTAIGPVKLGMLKQGAYRELTPEEVRALKASAKKGEKKDGRDTGSKGRGKKKGDPPSRRNRGR